MTAPLPSPISLKDIAAEAGVSVSTVSRALKHHPRIPKETCERIEQVAARLGYRPDARLAQLMTYLRKDKPSDVRCNIAWIDTSSHPEEFQKPWNIGYYRGAHERARQMGYHLDDIDAEEFRLRPQRINSVLRSRGVEGVILPQFWDNHPVAGALDWDAYCTVFLDEFSPRLHGSRVSAHYYWNIQLAMEKLRELGYRRPGVWISDFIDYNAARAYSAFIPWALERWFQKPHLPIPLAEGNSGLPAYLKKHRPDVLIVHTNEALDFLGKLGLRVPQDIGVIHLNLASDVEGWSGINQQHDEIGFAAVDSLVAQLQRHEMGVSRVGKQIFISGEWQDGFTAVPQ